MQGFQPQPEGDFGQQGFQYQDQQMPEPAPGPSGTQPPCPMPNKTTKLVALQCPQVCDETYDVNQLLICSTTAPCRHSNDLQMRSHVVDIMHALKVSDSECHLKISIMYL